MRLTLLPGLTRPAVHVRNNSNMYHRRSHPTGASKASGGNQMRYTVVLGTVFTICMAASTVSPQEKPATAQAKDAQLAAANKKPKNEVELMLENARNRGETIIRTCLENCDENSDANAVENEHFAKGQIVRLPKPP